MTAHRFRCFLDRSAQVGETVALSSSDVVHMRSIRARAGAAIDIVDATGRVFDAVLVDERIATLVADVTSSASDEPAGAIELYAGALTGRRWDDLVDMAVQAGVARIVPVVASERDRTAQDARRDRGMRVAEAAAKQAKRRRIPTVESAITMDELPASGVLLDPAADATLLRVLGDRDRDDACAATFLVGPAEGIDPSIASALVGAGWTAVSLGPTVMRSELAAAVAVSCAAQALRRP